MHIKSTLLLACLTYFAYAFTQERDPQQQTNEHNQEQSPHSVRPDLIEKYQPMITQLKQSIEQRTHPMVNKAESAYQAYEQSSVASDFFEAITKKQQEQGTSKTSSGIVLLFISSSMPERIIKAYLAQAESINTRIMVVLKGTIDNSLKLLPTIEYLKAIKDYAGCGRPLCQRSVNTVIDPRLFEQYGVSKVPALAYTGEFNHQGYFNQHLLPGLTAPTLIVGEASLPFLLNTLAQEINNESLKTLASANGI